MQDFAVGGHVNNFQRFSNSVLVMKFESISREPFNELGLCNYNKAPVVLL